MMQTEILRTRSAAVAACFLLWLTFLFVRPLVFDKTPDSETMLTELSGMRQTLEDNQAMQGGYPDSGSQWRIVALDPDGAFPETPAKLPALDAATPLPPVCVLYKSDGKDYKLILHFEDKALCRGSGTRRRDG